MDSLVIAGALGWAAWVRRRGGDAAAMAVFSHVNLRRQCLHDTWC
jgi:hypothetical protein